MIGATIGLEFDRAFDAINAFARRSNKRAFWNLKSIKTRDVYFLHSKKLRLIKVGMSNNVQFRAETIAKLYAPIRVIVVIKSAPLGTEAVILNMLKRDMALVAHTEEKEWLYPTTSVLSLIEDLSGDVSGIERLNPRKTFNAQRSRK